MFTDSVSVVVSVLSLISEYVLGVSPDGCVRSPSPKDCAHQRAVRDHETTVHVAHTEVLDLHQMAESVRHMAVDLPEYT